MFYFQSITDRTTQGLKEEESDNIGYFFFPKSRRIRGEKLMEETAK